MKMLRPLVLLITLLSIVSAALAIPPITLEIEELEDTIRSDQSATFILNVNNNQDFDDDFYVSAPRSQWDVSFADYFLQIPAGGTKTTLIRMTPPLTAPMGVYGIYFEIKSASDPSVLEYRYVHVNVNESLVAAEPEEPDEPELKTELTITEGRAQETMFKRSYSVTLENTGETLIEDDWSEIFTELDLLLLSSSPEYTTLEDYGDRKTVKWHYSLEPGDSNTISYSVSYYPLLIAGILLSLSVIGFAFYYTSAFKVKKTVSKPKGENGLRIEIAISNKTGKTKKNVVIEDYIPIPFTLVKKFDTIEPDSVTRHGNYLKVKWKLPELAPKEDRVLSYYLKSRLKVVGSVTLPQAVLTYKSGRRNVRAFSGTLSVVGKDIM